MAKRTRVRKRLLLAGTVSAVVALVGQSSEAPEGVEFQEPERNKWRVTAGPVFNFNVRSRLGFKTGRAVGLVSLPAGTQPSTGARQAALDRITGASDPAGVKRYEGGAWIDPLDSSGTGTETWNFSVPSAAEFIQDGQMTLRSATYTETAVGTTVTAYSGSSADDFATPGVNVEVSRELYYDPDWHYGIDLAVGISWFMRRNAFEGGGEICRRTDTTTTRTGYFTETFDVSEFMDPDGDYPLHDGVLGGGTFAGAGPVLRPGQLKELYDTSSQTAIQSVGAYLRGDYNEFEFTAALRPFYEPWKWLRLYGTLGLGMSYMHLSYSETVWYNGVAVRGNDFTEDDFDVYGVAGLGVQLTCKQILFGIDFNARPWADEVDVDSELMNGSISRGTWMFRFYLGFEF